MNIGYIFDELFITGELPENYTKPQVLAMALNAWGCVMAGADLPPKFGEGMAKVGEVLEMAATPENLMEYSKTI